MANSVYLTGARIVLSNEIVEDASLLIEDGVIRSINPTITQANEEVNIEGKILIPGMIDLHCDALEKEVEPRPGVHFPLEFAVAQADKRNAAAGITTVFHSLSFANEELGVRNNEFAADIARSVKAWQTHALVDNRVHCRYEITDESGPATLHELLVNGDMHLLSFMDHTPGQGQFKDVDAYRRYISKTYKTSDVEIDELIRNKQSAAEGAMGRIKQLINVAHDVGVATASHDDDNIERVETMSALGVNISEFPINLETAKHAKSKGMNTVFGAPNILRGKSQSGSMRAKDAVIAGVADCLCSDYSPAALIVAVFKLVNDASISLSDAIRLVTMNPARAANFVDRGEIAVGKRADLVAISLLQNSNQTMNTDTAQNAFPGLPQVSSVWMGGKLAYNVNYNHD